MNCSSTGSIPNGPTARKVVATKHYIIPTVVMQHNIGDGTGKFMGKRFNLHSPARNYYIVRNAAFLLRDSHMILSWRITMILYIPRYILVHAWLSQHRWRSVMQMLRAVWEGLVGTMRPFSAS